MLSYCAANQKQNHPYYHIYVSSPNDQEENICNRRWQQPLLYLGLWLDPLCFSVIQVRHIIIILHD